jgi:aminomethyltransferase
MQAQYSALTTPDGTVVDDLLVYRFAAHLFLVVNAGTTEKDWDWIRSHHDGESVELKRSALTTVRLRCKVRMLGRFFSN